MKKKDQIFMLTNLELEVKFKIILIITLISLKIKNNKFHLIINKTLMQNMKPSN